MLTVEDVVPYLLRQGLLEEPVVADQPMKVFDVSRRNRNFKLLADGGRGYFLKQGATADTARTVTREAGLFRWFGQSRHADLLSPLLPRFRLFDPDRCTLVVELSDSESLYEYQRQHRRLPRAVGQALGDALGTLHRLTVIPADDTGSALPAPADCVFALHRPRLEILATASPARLAFVKLLQQSEEVTAFLDQLNRDVRNQCVIHGDARWDNCRVTWIDAVRRPSVHFVDWELGGVGDPRADIGMVFGECLSTWLQSIPLVRDAAAADSLPPARVPLSAMQPAMRAFWRAYVRRMALDAVSASEWLYAAMRYAGSRLVQAMYEELQGVSRLPATAIYAVQLTINISARPRDAAAVLLGLP
ncbi:MAG TPA: phosphotransferase [Vicinamibacterales bacterium]|nr:phosphotransferase [Vicinamibacterales bacterium]